MSVVGAGSRHDVDGGAERQLLVSMVMASLSMRMQPCVTSLPSTDASLLPWMPISASPPLKVSSTSEWLDSP